MAFTLFRLLVYMSIAVVAVLYLIIKRVFYVPYETTQPRRRKFAYTSKQPKSMKSKKYHGRPPRARPSTPVTSSADSSSGSDTVVETPLRAPSTAHERSVVPRPPPPTPLEAFKTQLDTATRHNPFLSTAFTRLTTHMQTTLRICAGVSRTATLLHMVHGLHFSIAPSRTLPLRSESHIRHLSARELACVFLARYGPLFWPAESIQAPHLLDRSLQYPRDATISSDRHAEWLALMVNPPKRGSAADTAMSKLGRAMTRFVELVYELPWDRRAEVDLGPAAMVLDVIGITEEWYEDHRDRVPEGLESVSKEVS